MTTKSIIYNGLTITSEPMWYPDENAYGVLGTIAGVNAGNGGNQNLIFPTATEFLSNKDDAHNAFFEQAKKHIEKHHLS